MINSIIAAISSALYAEFGDGYEISTEGMEQEWTKPCFLISCQESSMKPFHGERYFRRNRFCIQYFPQNGNHECHSVAERMLWTLEDVRAEEDSFHGAGMEYKIADQVLNFFVNYDFYFYRHKPEEDVMDTADMQIKVKGDGGGGKRESSERTSHDAGKSSGPL